MTQYKKSFARESRGTGNGHNENWYNSPLWDSIGPKKKEEEHVVIEEKKDETLKDKQKRMYSMVY